MNRSTHFLTVALFSALSACSPNSDAAPSLRTSQDGPLRERAAELLPEVERLSGLPARGPLNLGVRSRSDLEAFLQRELAEQFAGDRIRNVMRVYARLGLVPDSLDLEPLLGRLLLEQVVGFYDPASDTLFVVEGVDEGLVDAVLVHEMVHALQDQYVDLDSLSEATRERNDSGMAFQAAVEGHATFVMLEWMLGQMMGSSIDLTRMPRLSETLGDDALGAAGMEMPELQQAPAIIREQLLFPYVAGLDFVQARWTAAGGRPAPLGEGMPATTEQILHPGAWGTPADAAPRTLDFGGTPGPGWKELVSDGLGEFDLRLFLREFLADRAAADAAAAGWDGDVYRLFDGPAGEVLIWVSRWDDAGEAREFAAAVRRALDRRYEGTVTAERDVTVEVIGSRTVRVVDAPGGGGAMPPEVMAIDGVE